MQQLLEQVRRDMDEVVEAWEQSGYLKQGQLFVVGCSTSEVAGEAIGSSGSEDIAEVIFSALDIMSRKTGVHLAFQGCEHINRALTLERSALEKTMPYTDEVNVMPVPDAGGSMAYHAYQKMADPVVVENVDAGAGMDIGDTLIGMQLRHVAVPVRLGRDAVGHAHLTAARTRPKLIGGKRAHYPS